MTKKKSTKVESRRVTYYYLGLPILIFLIFAVFILYNFFYSTKVFPNVYIAGTNLGGLSAKDAYSAINNNFDNFSKSQLEIVVADKKDAAAINEWGVKLDPEATTKRIYSIGRTGNILDDSYVRLKALIKSKTINPVYSIDYPIFAEKSKNSFEKYSKEPKDATLVFLNGSAQVKAESDGQRVDEAQFIDDFKKDVNSLKADSISVNITAQKPNVNSASVEKLKDKVNTLASQDIVFSFGLDKWTLTNANLFAMFKFYPTGYEDSNLVSFDLGKENLKINSINIEGSNPLTLSIHLDEPKLTAYIDGISSQIDRPAKDATLKFENGKVSEFSPAQDGQALNRQLLLAKLSDTLSVDNEVFDKQIAIALPVAVTRAKIANDEVNTLGIRELVGKGVSYFAHSIPNRAWNVGLGTSRVSGTIVGPGEVFSFNKAVGEVNGATGYRQAYVISAGKTVLDDGGGICQVSTTVFRAALNAGFPIVARTAHAYRVGYYEQNGAKPGFDATVFSPSVDFQFKNDSANSILVQATADQNLARLEVDIYGTSDGRRVEIGDSVVSNQVPALPDRREDDPTLPVGQVKQVDFAAAGATAIFTRKVYKGNDLVLNDVFKSVYRPWAAVYLVGTKS